MMDCAIGTWPIKYLGVPVIGSKLHVIDWLLLDEKVLKRLDGWQGSSLSIGGSHPDQLLFEHHPNLLHAHVHVTKTMVKRMDKTRKRFFWQGRGTKRKYHLVKWVKITRSK